MNKTKQKHSYMFFCGLSEEQQFISDWQEHLRNVLKESSRFVIKNRLRLAVLDQLVLQFSLARGLTQHKV